MKLTNVDPDASEILSIALPGSKLPDWFIHQNEGSSVSVKLDPNWCDSKWMGFAISVFPQKWSRSSIYDHIRIDGQDWGFERLVETPEPIRYCSSDPLWLWLFYLPRDIYFSANWQNNCSLIEFSIETKTFDAKSYRDNEI